MDCGPLDARTARGHPVAVAAVTLGAALATLLTPPCGSTQSRDTSTGASRRLRLGLVSEEHHEQPLGLVDAGSFGLGLEAEPWTSATDTAGGRNLAFDLEISSDDGGTPVLSIDLGLDFDDGSWFFAGRRPQEPLERHVANETAAVIPGDRGRGLALTVDALELVARIREGTRERRRLRLPAGARVARNRVVDLVIQRDAPDLPSHVSVVPLTDGWLGETIHADCELGRCRVEGLPAAGSTLLVRGKGAALMPWNPADRELFVRLRPTGTVRLAAAPLDECSPPKVRVVAVRTGLPVPLAGWRQPGVGGWVDLAPGSLPLVLPEGGYWIETSSGRRQIFEVRAGVSEEVVVATCTNGVERR